MYTKLHYTTLCRLYWRSVIYRRRNLLFCPIDLRRRNSHGDTFHLDGLFERMYDSLRIYHNTIHNSNSVKKNLKKKKNTCEKLAIPAGIETCGVSATISDTRPSPAKVKAETQKLYGWACIHNKFVISIFQSNLAAEISAFDLASTAHTCTLR